MQNPRKLVVNSFILSYPDLFSLWVIKFFKQSKQIDPLVLFLGD